MELLVRVVLKYTENNSVDININASTINIVEPNSLA